MFCQGGGVSEEFPPFRPIVAGDQYCTSRVTRTTTNSNREWRSVVTSFEFLSAGIHVVFRGDDLCLSPEILADFEDRYVGRVSERTLRSMLVVTQNVAALSAHAERLGRKAVFGTTTFWYDNEFMAANRWSKLLIADLAKHRTRLRRLTGLECVWVLEDNGKNRRLHEQEVWGGFLELELVEKAKETVSGIGRCNVKEGFDPFYLSKEMGKRVGCRGTGSRHFGAMGPFAGKSVVRDFVLDSPMAECRRLAWAVRVTGESYGRTWEKAAEMFQRWREGKISLGEDYDKYRQTMVGFQANKGDAWEARGEDRGTDFNVEDFQ